MKAICTKREAYGLLKGSFGTLLIVEKTDDKFIIYTNKDAHETLKSWGLEDSPSDEDKFY
jgi:hypothetical protein